MTDSITDLRTSARLATLVPAMNVAVEHDWKCVNPPGVSFHTCRMLLPAQLGIPVSWDTEEAFTHGLKVLCDETRTRQLIRDATELVEARQIVFPMTSESGWHGVEGAHAMQRQMSEWAGGLPVTLGVHAIEAALHAFGVRRIAVIAPYSPVAIRRVAQFYTECGFDVVRTKWIRHVYTKAQDLANIPLENIRQAISDADTPDVDAIVQGGAAVSMLPLIEEAERELGKPMLALNPTVLWRATRSAGIDARLEGFGALWKEF